MGFQTINLKLKTLPQQTLTINPEHPIQVGALTSLNALLTHAIDLSAITLSYIYPPDTSSLSAAAAAEPPISSPQFVAAQLRLLSQSLAEASSLLKGPPLTEADPTWTTRSVATSHFTAPLSHLTTIPPQLSVHFSIQDSCLVLWLRSLEPADAPVNFGTKLALAIGTTRRLEHDEAEKVFGFCCREQPEEGHEGDTLERSPIKGSAPESGSRDRNEVEVFVREKVRVETGDPSLLSLSAKLGALSHTLRVARRNLAAVMGEELDD